MNHDEFIAAVKNLLRSSEQQEVKKGLMACTKLQPREAAGLVMAALFTHQKDQETATALGKFLLTLEKEGVLDSARNLAASQNSSHRAVSALALGILPWQESAALLNKLKNDQSQDVARIAAMSLRRLIIRLRENIPAVDAGSSAPQQQQGTADLPDEAEIKSLLSSTDPSVRGDIIRKIAFSMYRDQAILERLLDLLTRTLEKEDDERNVASIVMTVGLLCGKLHELDENKFEEVVIGSAGFLVPFLDSANTRVRANAVEALDNTGTREFWPLMATCLADPNNRTRANALFGLRNYNWIRPEKYLMEMIASCERLMQLSAVWTIGMFSREELIPLLMDERLAADDSVCEKAISVAEELLNQGFSAAAGIAEHLTTLKKTIVKSPVQQAAKTEALAGGMTSQDSPASIKSKSEVPQGISPAGGAEFTTADPELLTELKGMIESYNSSGPDEKKQVIFRIRNDQNQLHFNFLTYVSRLRDKDLDALIHLALRPYEGTGFADVTNQLTAISPVMDSSPADQLWGVQDVSIRHRTSTLQMNRELTEREKQYKATNDWGGKLDTQIQMLRALREDTQDMILASIPPGHRIERAYMCFFQEKFGFFEEGKKSLDSSKVIMSLKRNIGAFDNFSPTGELLWSIPQPRYLLCLVTTCNVVLFLRSGLDETRATTKSFHYDYIDGIQVRSKGKLMDVTLKMGEKSIIIPELSPPNARELEDLITVALT